MNTLLISLIPLIVFAILDSYTTLNIALIATCILTIIEISYSIYVFGELDTLTLLSIGLVFILLSLSYFKQNRVIFRLKPAILNISIGIYMIISFFIGTPIFIHIIEKYPQLVNEHVIQISQSVQGKYLFSRLSISTGIGFVIHSIIVAYSGINHSNFWWAIINSLGLIIILFLSSLFALI